MPRPQRFIKQDGSEQKGLKGWVGVVMYEVRKYSGQHDQQLPEKQQQQQHCSKQHPAVCWKPWVTHQGIPSPPFVVAHASWWMSKKTKTPAAL
mmetsp:Transcript_44783/g.104350  ORF Transcript_44783/g.104350 Transcript_44783/m.104350 type:complete len:93 (-) Transcript_44783:12-290(-)